jgi:hypothetical protein
MLLTSKTENHNAPNTTAKTEKNGTKKTGIEGRRK